MWRCRPAPQVSPWQARRQARPRTHAHEDDADRRAHGRIVLNQQRPLPRQQAVAAARPPARARPRPRPLRLRGCASAARRGRRARGPGAVGRQVAPQLAAQPAALRLRGSARRASLLSHGLLLARGLAAAAPCSGRLLEAPDIHQHPTHLRAVAAPHTGLGTATLSCICRASAVRRESTLVQNLEVRARGEGRACGSRSSWCGGGSGCGGGASAHAPARSRRSEPRSWSSVYSRKPPASPAGARQGARQAGGPPGAGRGRACAAGSGLQWVRVRGCVGLTGPPRCQAGGGLAAQPQTQGRCAGAALCRETALQAPQSPWGAACDQLVRRAVRRLPRPSRAAPTRAGVRRVWRGGSEAAGPRAFQHAAVPEAVAVAVADDARLHKRAAAGHRDRVRVVVAQVEVACRERANGRVGIRVRVTLPTPADGARAWPARQAPAARLPACGLSRASHWLTVLRLGASDQRSQTGCWPCRSGAQRRRSPLGAAAWGQRAEVSQRSGARAGCRMPRAHPRERRFTVNACGRTTCKLPGRRRTCVEMTGEGCGRNFAMQVRAPENRRPILGWPRTTFLCR